MWYSCKKLSEIPKIQNQVKLYAIGDTKHLKNETKSNTNFSHKIILDSTQNQKEKQTDNRWLGITFKESKTFIKFKNKMPYLSCGSLLELADENQKKEFFMLRSQENNSVNFSYPQINFTISKADTLMPIS